MITRCLARFFVPLLLLAFFLVSGPARGGVFTYGFDNDVASFVGTDGWDGAYCYDAWTTAMNGGVTPKTDDGCDGNNCAACDYEFAKFNGCDQSDPFDNHIHVGSEYWKDYVYRVKFKNTDDDTFGVVFRYTNSGAFYLFFLSQSRAPSATLPCTEEYAGSRLFKIDWPNAVTVLGNSTVTYETGKIHEIRVKVEGAHIKIDFDLNGDGQFSDSEAVFDVIDPSPHPRGSVGLFAHDNGAAGNNPCLDGSCWFDDLVVNVLSVANDPCQGISFEGVCEGNTLKWCQGEQLHTSQCQGCCKWDSGNAFYNCFWPNQCGGGCVNECTAGTSGCNDALTHTLQCADTDGDGCTELVQTWCDSLFCNPATGQCVPGPCTGNCTGKVCGDDGCGGSCGACPGGQSCVGGQCQCVADCAGKQCGSDGCGGSCGTCGDEQACINGQCQCQGSCLNKECGDDGCGVSCGTCDGGHVCQGFQCVCQGDCTAKECGDNGCGVSCGECGVGLQCKDFACVCAPACAGLQCGGDGCGGSCGDCGPDLQCVAGLCLCQGTCEGFECGDDGCGNSCGTCDASQICVKGQCQCVPDCTGKACGDNGCGGSCGVCALGFACQAGECVEGPCVPYCTGKQCGPDGCSGLCGSCDAQEVCVDGQCECVPECENKDCGPDGCGGECGQCDADGEECQEDKCVCVPACAGAQCGDDGCSGLCGICQEGFFCDAGVCTEGPCTPDCTNKNCGFDGCSEICGECLENEECDAGICKPVDCVPSCEGKVCGPDGCGGWCGECPEGYVCGNGACVCIPSCGGKECGDDGCGTTCGSCTPGQVCSGDGLCVPEGSCEPQAYLKCVGNTLYWFDSCDQQGAIQEVCDHLCVDNICEAAPVPDVVSSDVSLPDVTGDTFEEDGALPTNAEPVVFLTPPRKSGGCAQTSAASGAELWLLALCLIGLRWRRPRLFA